MSPYYDLSAHLAPHASFWKLSKGRVHEMTVHSDDRTPFQHDRDRIIHCRAFRRLQHKTQVFIRPDSDHYRTRLTHSLEVAQIARSLARYFGLDEDLCETIALAHDLGHSPFGHTGEYALDRIMADYGGFNHNHHTIRTVTFLEQNYATYPGLNLTWEALEGLVKHNGPPEVLPNGDRPNSRNNDMTSIMDWLQSCDSCFSPYHHASLEAQVAAISDDIAYNHHDLEDGLVDGTLNINAVCTALPHIAEARSTLHSRHKEISPTIERRELKRHLIHIAILDLIEESTFRIKKYDIKTVYDVRRAPESVIAFSKPFATIMQSMKSYLFKNLYEMGRLAEQREHARSLVHQLFNYYLDHPADMGQPYSEQALSKEDDHRHIVVKDFIAGMTDNYALTKYKDHVMNKDDRSDTETIYQALMP